MSSASSPASIAVIVCASILASCASVAPERAPASVGPRAGLEAELEELRAMVNRAHDQARVSESAPWVVDELARWPFVVRFGREKCGLPDRPDEASKEDLARCDVLYKKEMVDALRRRYFAADQAPIVARCRLEPLACGDPKILEGWMREAHNGKIEESRAEKLPKLDQWKRGEITGEQLQAALGLPSDGWSAQEGP